MSQEPSYQRLSTGEATTADDPHRGLWYGMCTYWTDNWNALSKTGPGIPCCPHCKGVGFQTTAAKWFDGAKAYEDDNNAGYREFLAASKERCLGPSRLFGKIFKWWKDNGKTFPARGEIR
jgi:hypothetical protein